MTTRRPTCPCHAARSTRTTTRTWHVSTPRTPPSNTTGTVRRTQRDARTAATISTGGWVDITYIQEFIVVALISQSTFHRHFRHTHSYFFNQARLSWSPLSHSFTNSVTSAQYLSGRMPDSQSREPRFESSLCYRFEDWPFSFSPRHLSSLGSNNVYTS